ncbi:porin family protein [Flavobacterium sp. MFBS3-15]|uniref:porin family protein n=1 Tax=Flavobacterium sp. MFBS3-15 TaxID=2989816 RepID=UPI0022360FDD|nr:porin family protein [Flavobacterium sp. MFBS3-15]MCW4467440.1 porin family protein [Flavobacterium sp. MFBS3-15]|tara:strand:- start:56 stop:583 length:528 start_codon:yes stop_codon:yes gene_type:complete
MKKILLSAVAVMAFGVAAQAQSEEMKFGVKAGANFSNFTGDFDADGATSFYVGGLVDLPVSGNFHVQPEVLYSMEGADKASLSYVRVPIMAKYYVMEGLSLQAGPEVAFKVAAEDDAMDEMTKSIDFGIGAGAAYELPMGLMFDVRYNLGMSNISDVDGVDMKNTGIQLGLGYRF